MLGASASSTDRGLIAAMVADMDQKSVKSYLPVRPVESVSGPSRLISLTNSEIVSLCLRMPTFPSGVCANHEAFPGGGTGKPSKRILGGEPSFDASSLPRCESGSEEHTSE